MLHLIFQFPFQARALERTGQGDALLFLENAVFSLLSASVQAPLLNELAATRQLYVLESDLEIRGLPVSRLISDVKPIDYAGFVTLTTQHKATCSWS